MESYLDQMEKNQDTESVVNDAAEQLSSELVRLGFTLKRLINGVSYC